MALHDEYELLDGLTEGDPDEENLMNGPDDVDGIPLTRYVWQVGGTGEPWEDDPDAV